VTTAANCERGTISPTDACQVGVLKAPPQPMRKVNVNNNHGEIIPNHTVIASDADISSMNTCAASITRRRSRLSATAPATNDNNRIGSATDACTSATVSAVGAIDNINHDAPTDWIKPPKLDSSVATQTARNIGWLKAEIGDVGVIV